MAYKLFILTTIFTGSFWGLFGDKEVEHDYSGVSMSMMPEICDNGIDDDMDGLIDLNDPDCDCHGDFTYYVPNPSFEDTTCCPCAVAFGTCIGESGRIECIPPWVNSNGKGFDFFHECANFDNRGTSTSIPLPVPDGTGFSGFFTRGSTAGGPIYKEYAIVCLNATMNMGERFELGISAGFLSDQNEDVELAIFGTDDCANANYANNDNFFGCPANSPDWVELATIRFDGNFVWLRDTVAFTVPFNINMIAFGASCDEDLIFTGDNYHLLDQIELVREDDRILPISITGADICAGIATLSIPNKPGATYQWYKDGVAIIGETMRMVTLPASNPSGVYQIRIMNSRGCFLSDPFNFLQEPITTNVIDSICTGDFYQLGPDMLTTAGMYIDTLPSEFNCDSIVNLDLRVIDRKMQSNPQDICQGMSIIVGSNAYTVAGTYFDTLPAMSGCDSVVVTELMVRQQGRANIVDTICFGDSILVASKIYNDTGIYFDTTQAINGCDSFIQIDLTVHPTYNIEEDYILCPGEFIDVNGEMIQETGSYLFELMSVNGCDSNVVINIDVKTNPVFLPIEKEVILGERVSIRPMADLGLIDTMFWKPSPNIEIINQAEVSQNLLPLQTGFITLQSIDTFGCVWMDSTLVRVTKPYILYTPNAFTPNGDGRNDYFRPYLGADIFMINSFVIVNRWGDSVFDVSPVLNEFFTDQMGWNGMDSGSEAESGVYMYAIEVEFIDGVVRQFSGDFTLIK